jgi:hypothetical protein
MFESNESRRDFLKKTAYVTPFILTMNVSLAAAQAGSAAPEERVEDFSASGTGEDFSASGTGGGSVGGVELGSSGWSSEYDGNGKHKGKHKGWYKPWYKWLDEREAHLLDRHDD